MGAEDSPFKVLPSEDQMKRSLALFATVALAGCVSAGTRVTDEQASKFERGKTTYDQVVRALGPPNAVVSNSDGTRTISYVFLTARPRPATFIPIVGLFAGGAHSESNTATFM